ncbi:hypothetical protein PoB_002107300 [Plakobranchus ocellatus]|uniref:Uncharacterized protein n=1 Tax=Plakobranchus ocellatus TaxID=259542 RepID=A0AAV3ZJB3_9GAST|nr:hypothetical protein PoB_002107300 [Plakobranchus ocellatus]
MISVSEAPPSGQGAGGDVRTRDSTVPVDLRADSLFTVPLMLPILLLNSGRLSKLNRLGQVSRSAVRLFCENSGLAPEQDTKSSITRHGLRHAYLRTVYSSVHVLQRTEPSRRSCIAFSPSPRVISFCVPFRKGLHPLPPQVSDEFPKQTHAGLVYSSDLDLDSPQPRDIGDMRVSECALKSCRVCLLRVRIKLPQPLHGRIEA